MVLSQMVTTRVIQIWLLGKQWTRPIPLMLSVNVFLYSCYPYDCYFNSFIKVFSMCPVKACVFYQLSSFLQNIICVRFYWRKMVEYLLRYESDKKEINELLWGCLVYVFSETRVQLPVFFRGWVRRKKWIVPFCFSLQVWKSSWQGQTT